jgi:hypothetical protein
MSSRSVMTEPDRAAQSEGRDTVAGQPIEDRLESSRIGKTIEREAAKGVRRAKSRWTPVDSRLRKRKRARTERSSWSAMAASRTPSNWIELPLHLKAMQYEGGARSGSVLYQFFQVEYTAGIVTGNYSSL